MLHKLCSSGDKGTFRQTDSKYIVAKKTPTKFVSEHRKNRDVRQLCFHYFLKKKIMKDTSKYWTFWSGNIHILKNKGIKVKTL